MGDYLLMKTVILFLITFFVNSSTFATELAWVDEQVEAIKPPRKAAKISSISSPFIFLEKNKTIKKDSKKSSKSTSVRRAKAVSSSKTQKIASDTKPLNKGLNLDAIINKYKALHLDAIMNSSALINGKWYKKSDKIKSYTIVSIDKTSITLKKGAKQMTLSTDSKIQNLKFKNK